VIDIEKYRVPLEKVTNVLGCLIYIAFFAVIFSDIIHNHRLSSVFPLLLTMFFAWFFLTRDLARQINLSLYDWIITMTGTFLPLCIRPAPLVHDYPLLLVVQTVGTCISIFGLLSLNKSVGLVAANRGVKTFWAYKYIRHPIYTGYFITYGAFCYQNFTTGNFIIIALWMTYEILRLFSEEKYLSQDPAYVEYMKKVRWRMIPYVF
jgi:protein-S-isoprenylcysteine O-methyltransferase Ste14